MPVITAVVGDITKQDVDAIVNAANNAMRGGGGVDGAIHRGGGPAILRDCIQRFPNGLATGDAGWTTAGDLPAYWVIHTVGPNYKAGQRDRSLLEACYRRALEVADELGARSIAFPLISTGAYGWPRADAIAAAVETLAAPESRVEDVRLVAFERDAQEAVLAQLASYTPLRILQGIRVLHQRGYHRVRALPGISASGMYWRVAVTTADNLTDQHGIPDVRNHEQAIMYSTGGLSEFAGGEVTVTTSPETVADLILNALPVASPTADDPDYVSWFATLMKIVDAIEQLPVAYADYYFDGSGGWEIGWSSGIRYPHPPAPPMREPHNDHVLLHATTIDAEPTLTAHCSDAVTYPICTTLLNVDDTRRHLAWTGLPAVPGARRVSDAARRRDRRTSRQEVVKLASDGKDLR